MQGADVITFCLHAKSLQSCPALCSPMFTTKYFSKCLQRNRTSSATAYTNVSVLVLSRVCLLVTPWAVARQAPQSMELFRQEYWSGLPFLPPGYLPDTGIEPESLESPALAGRFFTTEAA